MKIKSQSIEMMSVDELIPYIRNAKAHPPKQIEKIARSIQEYGFNSAILIDKNKEIIAGHGRLLAAKKLKIKEVPVIINDNLTQNQVRAFRIADNKLNMANPQIQKNTYKITEIPDWLGDPLRRQILEQDGILTHFFQFSEAERKIYRKKKKIPVSDWAERHRMITRGPLEGGRFKKTTVPYAHGIMDASFYPGVEEIVLCAADQVSKSFIMDTCLGYIIDRDPGPVLIVYPDESTAIENIKDRIIPMLKLSPRLRSYLTGYRDDESNKRVNLIHMQIYAAWASSAIQLANRSIKYLILDETDKYLETAGKKEAGPIAKAEKRQRTFLYGRKRWKSSTPTIESGPIWIEINSCQIVFEYHVSCPDCAYMHNMQFENIKWPEGERDPIKVENEELAYYICPGCGSIWNELKRNMAVRIGCWTAMAKSLDGKREFENAGMELFKWLKRHRPRKIGFYIPSWISPFVNFSQVAASFLKGLSNKNDLKDFRNSHQAVPWTDYTQEREENRILALRDDRPRGLVPGGGVVACLTAGVDTQGLDERGWFCYEVRAWGWGMAQESWQVREGYIDSFEALKEILVNERYADIDGNEYHIAMVIQDAMGRRTDSVYDFCRRNRGFIFPSQGRDTRRMTMPHRWSNIEIFPGTKRPIPGGIMLLQFDANYYKNILAGKLEINPEDPGAWHMHSETTEEWARQMCAEFVNDKGLWENPPGKANHGWDCSVLNILAADVLRVKFWQKKKAIKHRGPEREKEKSAFERPGWLKDRQ